MGNRRRIDLQQRGKNKPSPLESKQGKYFEICLHLVGRYGKEVAICQNGWIQQTHIMTKLELLEKAEKEHAAKIAELKDGAVSELVAEIAELKSQLAEKAALYAKLTGKNLSGEKAEGAKRNRLTNEEREALPGKVLDILRTAGAKGAGMGKIVAELEGIPVSSIKTALKANIDEGLVEMKGTKNSATYHLVPKKR